MLNLVMIILLATGGQAYEYIEKWVDKMINQLVNRVLNMPPIHHADLDNVTLVKTIKRNLMLRAHPRDMMWDADVRPDGHNRLIDLRTRKLREGEHLKYGECDPFTKYANCKFTRVSGVFFPAKSSTLRRSLKSDVLAAAWLAAEDDTSYIGQIVDVARLAVNDKRNLSRFHPWDGNSLKLCLAVLGPLSLLVTEAVTGELPHPQWQNAIAHVLSDPMPLQQDVQPPSIGSLNSSQVLGFLVHVLSESVPIGSHVKRLERALDAVLHSKATGTLSCADTVSALLFLLVGATRLQEHSSFAEFMLRRILCELAALAKPPLGTEDNSYGILIGLVQVPFLDSLARYFPLASVTDAAALDALPVISAMNISSRDVQKLFLAAAELARRSENCQTKHGCLLVEDATQCTESERNVTSNTLPRILGEGWNHRLDCPGRISNKGFVVHAECHAIADAIRNHGEKAAFAALRSATAWIVELRDDVGYDDSPPCSRCLRLLRAFGVRKVVYSTREGTLHWRKLWPKPHKLIEATESTHLMDVCAELGVNCTLLPEVLKKDYSVRMAAWRTLGRQVCGHGVFFDAPFGTACRCKNASSDSEAWSKARFMPALDSSLRCMVAVPFDRHRFQPLDKLGSYK